MIPVSRTRSAATPAACGSISRSRSGPIISTRTPLSRQRRSSSARRSRSPSSDRDHDLAADLVRDAVLAAVLDHRAPARRCRAGPSRSPARSRRRRGSRRSSGPTGGGPGADSLSSTRTRRRRVGDAGSRARSRARRCRHPPRRRPPAPYGRTCSHAGRRGRTPARGVIRRSRPGGSRWRRPGCPGRCSASSGRGPGRSRSAPSRRAGSPRAGSGAAAW